MASNYQLSHLRLCQEPNPSLRGGRRECYHSATVEDWDEDISLLLFVVRESVQESLRLSPFELVFGHSVRGPLKLLKEYWLSENTKSLNLLHYVSKFRSKLKKASEQAQQNLKQSQSQMKMLYDRKSQNCVFNPGGNVSVSSPGQRNILQATDPGSYLERESDRESGNSPLDF